MHAYQQKDDPKILFKIGDAKVNQVHKFKYLANVLTGDEKCDTMIVTLIEMANDAFQILSTVFFDSKISLDTKKTILIAVLLYSSWTVSSKTKKTRSNRKAFLQKYTEDTID